MTIKTIKIIVFITLLVHGIGHLQGVVSSMGIKFNNRTSNISWALSGLGVNTNRTVCLFLYLSAAVFGILASLSFAGIWVPHNSWQILALATAFFSAACLVLFPAALAMVFNKIGAIAVNLIIFYSILLHGNWPLALFNE